MTVPRSISLLVPIFLIVIGSILAACAVQTEAPVSGDGPLRNIKPCE